ncbi:MAG TPA: YceI family protein [Pyrinomonadaceae bacterium]|jgi:polyisoprenoid-binding protein YceI
MLKKYFALAAVCCLLLVTVAPASLAASYEVDTAHSTVGFSVPILGGLSRVSGKFSDFKATIVYDEADITKSSVTATIKTASIDTGIQRRDDHLRTADFFDAEKYPEITFQSSRVEKKGKQLILHGTLTMHGVAKEVAIPFSITGKNTNPDNKKVVGFAGRLKLNRRDYGIAYTNKNNPTFIGDEIEIELNLITRPS